MYRNKKIYDIKYTDVDAYDNLKPSSFLSFAEESACLSADELGFGYKDVHHLGMGFVIANWYFEFLRPVKLAQKLEIHTWPLRPRFSIFFRDYELFVNDEKVGVGTARWCMIDINTFETLSPSAFFKDGAFDDYNVERSIDYKNWKIPQIEAEKPVYSKSVKYSDYDHYFHVNNTKYADFLLDVFNVDEFKDKFVKSFQISYVKQCKYGEVIDFYRKDFEGFSVVEGRVNGELRVQMRVELK